MGIVPGFEYDIFLSYSHVNNQCLAEQDKGWVNELHDTLYKKLLERFPRPAAIFHDESRLDGRMADPSIYQALHSSALMVTVLSDSYLSKPYCTAELNEFCTSRHPAFELVVRGFSRLVTVVYDDIPLGQWREEMRNGPSVRFLQSDEATGANKRFCRPARSNAGDPYWEAVDKLVRHLEATLRELQRGPSTGPAIVTTTSAGAQLPVYLAEATDDLQGPRNDTLELLNRGSKRAGAPVLPGRSILDSVSVVESCRDGLARANASVHLINATPGRIWRDAGKPLPQLELEEALKRSGKPRPLVWIPPDLKPESVADAGYRDFLTKLKNGKLEVRDPEPRTPEIFEMPFDRFLGQVETRLFPPIPSRDVPKSQNGPGWLVYISHRAGKPDQLSPLIDALRRRKYAVSLLDHGAPNPDLPKRHQANLKFCDGLMLMFTPDAVSWAEELALEARMIARQSRRPKKLGVLENDGNASIDFGLIDDLVIPIQQNAAGYVGLDDFLAAIEDQANG